MNQSVLNKHRIQAFNYLDSGTKFPDKEIHATKIKVPRLSANIFAYLIHIPQQSSIFLQHFLLQIRDYGVIRSQQRVIGVAPAVRGSCVVAYRVGVRRGGGFRGVGLGVRVIVWVFGRECGHCEGLLGFVVETECQL
jgi:hypothetical protein